MDVHGAGEIRRALVVESEPDAWFAYPYWLDDARAPDFARTVDIHRKPGYDPVELFLDPSLKLPTMRVGLRLAQKAAGMRYLMDVIPLDTKLVRGSHGRITDDPSDGPLVITSEPDLLGDVDDIDAVDFKSLVLKHVFD